MATHLEDVRPRTVAEYGHPDPARSRSAGAKPSKRDDPQQFGLSYVQKNKNGNWGIRLDVLKEFNALTNVEPNDLVWMMSSQTWPPSYSEAYAGRFQNGSLQTTDSRKPPFLPALERRRLPTNLGH